MRYPTAKTVVLALSFILSACATSPQVTFKNLCETEGGWTIFERAKLPAEHFTPEGRFIERWGHPPKDFSLYYSIRTESTQLETKENIKKSVLSLYRNSDGKLMARNTTFYKRWPSVFFEPKVELCPTGEEFFAPAFVK